MADDIAIGIDLGTSLFLRRRRRRTVSPWSSPTSGASDPRLGASPSSKTAPCWWATRPRSNIITNAENTVYSAKRLIGRYFFSDEVKKAQAVMPYQIVEGDEQLGAHPGRASSIYSLPGDLRAGAQGDEGDRRELPRPRR